MRVALSKTLLDFAGCLGASYLAWRLLVLALRVRWARNAYTLGPSVSDAPMGAQRDRVRGCLVGAASGDALCLPSESLPRWLVRLRYPGRLRMRRGLLRFLRRAGDVSDDTQLSIATARSISPAGGYVHERFLTELGLWSYMRIGAGRACSRASVALRRGAPAPAASCGDGAAIRVAPLALAINEPVALMTAVRRNARATHSESVAVDAAVFHALLIRACLTSPHGMLDDVCAFDRVVLRAQEMSGYELPARSPGPPSGHVNSSMPAVVAVLRDHGTRFSQAMESVFRLGGDTDSVAAMVGACIGAQIGYTNIPNRLSETVQHHDVLLALAGRLALQQVSPGTVGELVVIRGNIVQCHVEAIVNAWNRNVIPSWLLLPQGVARAIGQVGGRQIIRDVSRRGPMPLGSAVETTAGALPARWVIHATAIDLRWRSSEASIRLATRSALHLAHWLGARTVAIPLLGAGTGGISDENSLAWIREESEEFLDRFERIELVRWSPKG